MTPERNDPTRAGFTPPVNGAASLSCSEVEALCLKAARGAGLSWGLAEEAGFAARWLYQRGIDGPGALLARLEMATGASSQVRMARGVIGVDDGGVLCPIAVGAALSDCAAACPGCAGPVMRPLLVLPFVHQIAQASLSTMRLDWSEGRVCVSPEGEVSGTVAALGAADLAEIAVAAANRMSGPAVASHGFAATSVDTLARLDHYAMLTTVPASATSRADAGSAKGDND